jgi:RNA polymerase sigma-70 factor (ECF subfamily)
MSVATFSLQFRRAEFELTGQDELTLLAGVRRLDPQALAEVHNTYYPAIFRFIAFRVGQQEVAEDLTSEVFLRLLSAVRDRHAPQNTLRGWLYGVASRVVADHHRQHYRAIQRAVDPPSTDDLADPVATVYRQETLDSLYRAMSELTEEQRDVIAMRFGMDMPIREVANALGKSEGAVKQLQARAIAALSHRLDARSTEG